MAEGTNFKFGRHVPRDSPDVTLTTVSEKWAWSGSRDPVNFWALNANSSETTKDTNFKFGRRVSKVFLDMTYDKCFQKVGVVGVT